MVYRYKLAQNDKTENIKHKMIQGVKLTKKDWVYTKEQINFGAFSDLVIEESNVDKATIRQDEKERLRRISIERKKSGKQVIKDKKLDMKNHIKKLTKDKLDKKTSYELQKILHDLGFPNEEFVDLDKHGLVNIILLEKELGVKKEKKVNLKDKVKKK